MNVLLALLAIITVIVFCVWCDRRRRQRFNDRWPVISDDEFLAKCTPGTSRDTALRVRRIVAEQLYVPYDRVHPDQHFVDDLDCC